MQKTDKQKTSNKLISEGILVGKKALSLAEMILIELIEQVEDMEYIRTHCYAVIGRNVREARYDNEIGKRLHAEKMRRQAVKRLVNHKFIQARKEGERLIYVLTRTGTVRAIKAAIRNCSDYYYDRRMALITFDFPEAAHDARTVFRRMLKSLGFTFVQGSVWSINKNVVKELEVLVAQLKIGRWVEIYEARQ